MYSALRVGEYVFDTWALQTAFGKISLETSKAEGEYSEESLRTLIELFCDWGPSRSATSKASAADSIDNLSTAEKRDLYERCCSELARNLEGQYGYDVSESDIRQFAETLATDGTNEDIADFLLTYLWKFSQQLHEFDPNADEVNDAQPFLNAVRNLPEEYQAAKRAQYEGSEKVNQVRYQILESFHNDGEIPIEKLEKIKQEENERFDKNILQAWRNYTILGQLYFDFFKPRIDSYQTRLADYLATELGVEDLETHTVHFTDPHAYLSDFAWMAIYPEGDGNQRDRYQLYLGIHWNRLSYGLHVGDNLRDDGWKTHRDLDQLQDIEHASISTIVEKFRTVKSDFLTLNGLSETEDPAEKPPRSDEIMRQLQAAKQVVFYGPPGTGKTYVAKRFAEWWVQEQTGTEPIDEQIQTVTFHPSFAYEDFMEGLTATTNDGNVSYEIEEGIFKRVADTARDAYLRARQNDESPPPYILIIDEINRGNLAQIFGETITQLEGDKRLDEENETVVQLAHSDDSFVIPPNLYLIGTMNTADRSIALVDAALRRRFRFIAFPPAFDDVIDEYDLPDDPLQDGDDFDALLWLSIQTLREMNDRITKSADLGKGKQIGHARLFGLSGTQEIRDAWRYDILPLLEEYYFGQFARIRQDLFDGGGEELFDWERKQIRDFTEQDLADALGDVVGDGIELSYSSPDSNTTSSTGSRKQWNKELFFEEIESTYDPEIVAVYRDLHDFAADEADEVGYGSGVRTGAMQFYWNEFHDGDYLVFESRTDGNIQFRFWGRDQYDKSLFERFSKNIEPVLEEPVDAEYLLSDEFNDLEIPAERLVDEEIREQFKTTVRQFVDDCAVATQ